MRWLHSSAAWWTFGGGLILALSGCASVNVEQSVQRVNEALPQFTSGELALARTEADQAARRQRADALLAGALAQGDAVRLALLNSPALQALIAQSWAEAATAAQAGRLANPILTWERLTTGAELELSRSLSVGLLDLLLWPSRQAGAQRQIELTQLRLTSEVVDQVTQVRQAWVRAVAAQQVHRYAQQVYASAEAAAELAKRMQAAGNFNRISRAREQAFYADAATRLAMASHQVTASREDLVRLLGLTDEQALRLVLPDRLPDLPREAQSPEAVSAQAMRNRLDVRMAQAALGGALKAQGITAITSLTDLELTARRDTRFDNATGGRSSPRGYEVGVRLPVLDWGGLQRDAMDARVLAAVSQLESTWRAAGSGLRKSYSAYRTTLDIAKHHRDEVVPLRKVISDENQLRYNGMLIGVFELLADARDQVAAVMAAIEAEQQFWLADAALQASLVGRPTGVSLWLAPASAMPNSAAH